MYLATEKTPASTFNSPTKGAYGRTKTSHRPAIAETQPKTAPERSLPNRDNDTHANANPQREKTNKATTRASEAIPNPLAPIYPRRTTYVM